MRCWSRPPRALVPAALCWAALAGIAPVQAQAPGARVGVAYVANAPDLMTGGGVYLLLPAAGGLGVYLDAKVDLTGPSRESNFLPDLTAAQVEEQYPDIYEDSKNSWRSFNAALIRPVSPALMVYAGGGLAHKTTYKEYRDETETRGTLGHYWVEDRASDGVNLMAGVFFRMSRFVFAQFGLESAPGGATVGLSVALPPR